MYKLAVCAIVKNEYEYLLEWIAYHQAVGVDHFLLYDNGSDDKTTWFLNRLQEIGAVELVPWPDRPEWRYEDETFKRPQIPAYYDGVKRLQNRAEWVAFIDADEFIVPMREHDLPSTLRMYWSFGGVGANWRMFGSSGAMRKENLPVCRRFTMAGLRGINANHHVKSIARPELIRGLNVHRPFLERGVFVDEHGREITGENGLHDRVSYDFIRINHYFTKSYEEFAKKVERGRADHFNKRTAQEFSRYDTNHERDTFVWKFYDSTTHRMQELQEGTGIEDYPCLIESNSHTRVGRGYVPYQACVSDVQGPILDVSMAGTFATRMIQYMVVRSIAAQVEGCRISNASLPEWNIVHPPLPGIGSVEGDVPISPQRVNVPEMVRLLNSGKQVRVDFRSCALWLPNFPGLDICRTIFSPGDYPEYGSAYLVCNIRGGDILGGSHPDHVLLPVEFYEELARNTGLELVFLGQIEDDAYCRALKRRFPDAVFHRSTGDMAEFQILRNCRNLVPAVSTFSWLAAWLSHAETVFFPVNGLFHPVQRRDLDLLPVNDERYRFYLFPINYSVPADHFEKTHRAIAGRWRYIRREAVAELRASPPRWPKRLEEYVSMFDEEFYLKAWPDVAEAVALGGWESGLDHFVRDGFAEGYRRCFPFDERWYSREYPLAAYEVGCGEYSDLMHHYVEVGAMRGYKPAPEGAKP